MNTTIIIRLDNPEIVIAGNGFYYFTHFNKITQKIKKIRRSKKIKNL